VTPQIAELTLACAGRFSGQQTLMCTLHLEQIDHLAGMIARSIPGSRRRGCLSPHRPTLRPRCRNRCARPGHHLTAAHLASWAGDVGAQLYCFYRRFGKKGGTKAAIATAHNLIVIIWHVLAESTAYRDLGSD
jgi:hypothetical protein